MPSLAEIEYYFANLLNRCHKCYSSLNTAKEITTDMMDYIVMESKLVCSNCNADVDYWAHGNSENECHMREFETQHPKAAELIQRIVGKK